MEEIKTHEVVLKNTMPKSREYLSELFEASSLLVSEQADLVPIYINPHFMSFAEARAIDAADDEFRLSMVRAETHQELDDFRGNIENLVFGMKKRGYHGYPELIVLTDDLNSTNPAVTNPRLGEFCFEIKPKRFNLGLTGRLLQDSSGQMYNERLFVDMDIFDAYDFATSFSPKTIVAIMPDKKGKVIYCNRKEVGQKRKFEQQVKKRHLVFDESDQERWLCDSEVLNTDGLKVIKSPMYESVSRYGERTLLFGHRFKDISQFLRYATKYNDHLIWKICLCDLNDPNTPLIDAEPHYGKYRGQTRYENVNRLHFMPNKAKLWFNREGTSLWFDKQRGLEALFSLGDVVRDLWIDNSFLYRNPNAGWDIVLDRIRGIVPENPVTVKSDIEYKNYPVLI